MPTDNAAGSAMLRGSSAAHGGSTRCATMVAEDGLIAVHRTIQGQPYLQNILYVISGVVYCTSSATVLQYQDVRSVAVVRWCA